MELCGGRRHRFDLRLYLVEDLERPAEDTRHTRHTRDDRVEVTVPAMGRPGEQTFAIDQELLIEVRQHGGDRDGQDRTQRMPSAAPLAWVGDLGEVVKQAAALVGCQHNRGAGPLHSGGDAR